MIPSDGESSRHRLRHEAAINGESEPVIKNPAAQLGGTGGTQVISDGSVRITQRKVTPYSTA